MDMTFREDAPNQLFHLCFGTEAGAATQDAININKAIVASREELADEHRTRTEQKINTDIGVLEADSVVHQSNFNDELNKVKRASDYLPYILVHSTKTGSEPNQFIRRLCHSENGFASWKLLRLRHRPLLQNILALRWTEQRQRHQFRTWMEDMPNMRVTQRWSSTTTLRL